MKCPTCSHNESIDEYKCYFCGECCNTLYEGWFYALEKNEFNTGTATSGLMYNTIACKVCADRRKFNGK